VVAKVMDRLTISKQAAQKHDVETESQEAKIAEGYETVSVKFSNRFAALENLNDSRIKNRAWEIIIENVKTSAQDSLDLYELK
jgi:hypothetical protein